MPSITEESLLISKYRHQHPFKIPRMPLDLLQDFWTCHICGWIIALWVPQNVRWLLCLSMIKLNWIEMSIYCPYSVHLPFPGISIQFVNSPNQLKLLQPTKHWSKLAHILPKQCYFRRLKISQIIFANWDEQFEIADQIFLLSYELKYCLIEIVCFFLSANGNVSKCKKSRTSLWEFTFKMECIIVIKPITAIVMIMMIIIKSSLS